MKITKAWATATLVPRITFQFTREGEEVHLSGIAVAREEEKEGSLGAG